jgi:hypothetical protein
VILAFSNPFSSSILILALFYKEVPIRAIISIAYSELIIIKRIINNYKKLKEARCKKIIIIIITVKAI